MANIIQPHAVPEVAGVLLDGTRLGRYELLRYVGAGGMGCVYCARDTLLGRLVAVKALPVTRDTSLIGTRHRRFQVEVKALAALSHPNICAVYDAGCDNGTEFLVMEYLEGQTLADRLQNGPLPLDEMLENGLGLAGALAHAHKRGITHRDVKPRNVILTPEGCKLLDFGIASGNRSSEMSAAPLDATATSEASILGSVQYMAPEQLQGLPEDARADIFSLGLVLYEMSTGRRPFARPSAAAAVAATLSGERPPSLALPDESASRMLDHVITKCLAHEPDHRWQSAEDLKSELRWVRESLSSRSGHSHLSRRRLLTLAIAAILVGAAGTGPAFRSTGGSVQAPSPIRFLLPPPSGNNDQYFGLESALSPDGRQFVSTSALRDGTRPLWLRPLDALEGRALPDTNGAHYPFWSADSRSVGYFDRGYLKTISLADSHVTALAAVAMTSPAGGTWNADGTIVIGSDHTGLFKLLPGGGTAVPLTHLDAAGGEIGHNLPHFLPDGQHILYLLRSTRPKEAGVYVTSLQSPERRFKLLDVQGEAWYAQGYVLFSNARKLFAQRLELEKMRLNGPRMRIAGFVGYNATGGRTGFSVSQNGLLAYQPAPERELTWFDAAGAQLGTFPVNLDEPAISFDEHTIAGIRVDPTSGDRRLWVATVATGNMQQVTRASRGDEAAPVWHPDGRRIIYSSNRNGRFDIFSFSTDTAEERLLLASDGDKWPLDITRDGRYLLFRGDGSAGELRALRLDGTQSSVLLAVTLPAVATASLSPDGNWMAYAALGGTRSAEVYTRRFPSGTAAYRISVGGGTEPKWSGDGRRLFYLSPSGTVMEAHLAIAEEVVARPAVRLFDTLAEGTAFIGTAARNQYAVSRTGDRFLVNQPRQRVSATPIYVVVNWSSAAVEH